jgi:hypothetical protein
MFIEQKNCRMPCQVVESSLRQKKETISEEAFAVLIGVLVVSIQLQSFSLLSVVAMNLIEIGDGISLGMEGDLTMDLINLLEVFLKKLECFDNEQVLPFPHSRYLQTRWKTCSYKPSTSDSIASDGDYLYVFGRSGLYKIGTGNGFTVRDFVYSHNKAYYRHKNVDRSWMVVVGNFLYCRSITMPGNRVDRISCEDLHLIEELYFAPNRSLFGNGILEGSVCGLISDGKHLYTVKKVEIKCKNKKVTSRAKKKKSKQVRQQSITVGDRVMRGPDWKWSSQDGGEGNLGTVERISAWGQEENTAVTVKWDNNQWTNTYRWGAKGFFDLVIVTEKDGEVLERNMESFVKKEDTKSKESSNNQRCPRHQFVLYRHDVSRLVSMQELSPENLDVLFRLKSCTDTEYEKCNEGHTHDDEEEELNEEVELLSALHHHHLAANQMNRGWMCDGGLEGCLGGESDKRYRCMQNCDYDLCENCFMSTMISSPPITEEGCNVDYIQLKDENEEGDTIQETQVLATDIKKSQGERNQAAEDGAVENPDIIDGQTTSKNEEKCNEEGAEDEALFPPDTLPELHRLALRLNGRSLEKAALWMEEQKEQLGKKNIIQTNEVILLDTSMNHGALDSSLLISGSLYATEHYLCVISPAGMYSVNENESEKVRQAISSFDAIWAFSLNDGSLLNSCGSPVLVKGVPAGSPICADLKRDRILVYSGYLNCIEEYLDLSQKVQHVERVVEVTNRFKSSRCIRGIGTYLLSRINCLIRNRRSLPAYKQPKAALEEILTRTEREGSRVRCRNESRSSQNGEPKSSDPGTAKRRNRRIKNIRCRLLDFDNRKQEDNPGYFIPFCADFAQTGLLAWCEMLNWVWIKFQAGNDITTYQNILVHILDVLVNIFQEYDVANIKLVRETNDRINKVLQETETNILVLAQGDLAINAPNGVLNTLVILSQQVLLWGIHKNLFFKEAARRFSFLTDTVRCVSNSPVMCKLYRNIMMLPLRDLISLEYQSKMDYAVSLLRHLIVHPMDDNRISLQYMILWSINDVNILTKLLFDLIMAEHRNSSIVTNGEFPFISPASKALISLLNHCSVALYDEERSWMRGNSTLAPHEQTIIETFEGFSEICFSHSMDLLRSNTSTKQSLKDSIIGTVLPLVISTIANFPSLFSVATQNKIIDLLKCMDALVGQDPNSKKAHPKTTSAQIIESSHPYKRNQFAFRRVIHIPGARCLHFDFDPRCQTPGETDFVLIVPGVKWLHSEGVLFGEIGIGEQGGCFFGNYETGNWPVGGMTILGDTATVMLSASKNSSEGNDSDVLIRWGLRCSVRGVFDDDSPSSLQLELGAMIAHCCCTISDHLLQASTSYEWELKCAKWTDLFSRCNPIEEQKCDDKFLSKFIHEKLTPDVEKVMQALVASSPLAYQLSKQRLKICSSSEMESWIFARRLITAIFILLSSRKPQFPEVGSLLDDEFKQELICISVEVGKIEQWMLRRAQLITEWYYLREESLSFAEFKDRYSGNVDRVRELCSLFYDVPFDEGNMDTCITKLHEILNSEIQQQKTVLKPPVDRTSYAEVAQDMIQRAQFLLKHLGSSILSQLPSTTIKSFFYNSVEIELLEKCLISHSERLNRRLQGLDLLHTGLRELQSYPLKSIFIGHLWKAAVVQDFRRKDSKEESKRFHSDFSLFRECILAERSLKVKMYHR